MVLAKLPFGNTSRTVVVGESGRNSNTIERDDFWATTVNMVGVNY